MSAAYRELLGRQALRLLLAAGPRRRQNHLAGLLIRERIRLNLGEDG